MGSGRLGHDPHWLRRDGCLGRQHGAGVKPRQNLLVRWCASIPEAVEQLPFGLATVFGGICSLEAGRDGVGVGEE